MRHLDNDELAAAIAGLELEAGVAEHLASCLSCRRQVEETRALFERRRQLLAEDEPDWQRQRREILRRLPTAAVVPIRRTARWLRPALAAAAVVLVVLGLGLLRRGAPHGGEKAPEIAVEQILADVDAVLDDDAIPGFESIDPGMANLEKMYANRASRAGRS